MFRYVFGFDIDKSQYLHVTMDQIFKNIGDTKYVVTALGCSWIIGLGFLSYASKNWDRWKPLRPFGPLIFCLLGTYHDFQAQ